MARITKAHHARVVAAYKGQITRLTRALAALAKRKGPKRRKRKLVPRPVDELVLYEADPAEAALAFAEWDEYPGFRATVWAVKVELLIEGVVQAAEELKIAANWTTEPASRTIRREIRSWYDQQIADHPAWSESPQAGVIRVALRYAESV